MAWPWPGGCCWQCNWDGWKLRGGIRTTRGRCRPPSLVLPITTMVQNRQCAQCDASMFPLGALHVPPFMPRKKKAPCRCFGIGSLSSPVIHLIHHSIHTLVASPFRPSIRVFFTACEIIIRYSPALDTLSLFGIRSTPSLPSFLLLCPPFPSSLTF